MKLNSFYNKSYKEGAKARVRLEKTNNSKTRAKYQKLYDEHNNNFNKAEFLETKLYNIDFSNNDISEIVFDNYSIYGAVIDPLQSQFIVGSLGVRFK